MAVETLDYMTDHHRKPRFLGGSDESSNISRVRRKEHEAYHLLFNHMTPEKIAELLNEKWIDHEWTLVVVKKGGNNEPTR